MLIVSAYYQIAVADYLGSIVTAPQTCLFAPLQDTTVQYVGLKYVLVPGLVLVPLLVRVPVRVPVFICSRIAVVVLVFV
eukprot:scaffold47625_cov51-Prasinocladus_malaysianus.AAC.1